MDDWNRVQAKNIVARVKRFWGRMPWLSFSNRQKEAEVALEFYNVVLSQMEDSEIKTLAQEIAKVMSKEMD